MRTQEKIIKDQLTEYGTISRNWCLRRYISRLGAYICDLKKAGWQFQTESRNGDYYYKLLYKPNDKQTLF